MATDNTLQSVTPTPPQFFRKIMVLFDADSRESSSTISDLIHQFMSEVDNEKNASEETIPKIIHFAAENPLLPIFFRLKTCLHHNCKGARILKKIQEAAKICEVSVQQETCSREFIGRLDKKTFRKLVMAIGVVEQSGSSGEEGSVHRKKGDDPRRRRGSSGVAVGARADSDDPIVLESDDEMSGIMGPSPEKDHAEEKEDSSSSEKIDPEVRANAFDVALENVRTKLANLERDQQILLAVRYLARALTKSSRGDAGASQLALTEDRDVGQNSAWWGGDGASVGGAASSSAARPAGEGSSNQNNHAVDVLQLESFLKSLDNRSPEENLQTLFAETLDSVRAKLLIRNGKKLLFDFTKNFATGDLLLADVLKLPNPIPRVVEDELLRLMRTENFSLDQHMELRADLLQLRGGGAGAALDQDHGGVGGASQLALMDMDVDFGTMPGVSSSQSFLVDFRDDAFLADYMALQEKVYAKRIGQMKVFRGLKEVKTESITALLDFVVNNWAVGSDQQAQQDQESATASRKDEIFAQDEVLEFLNKVRAGDALAEQQPLKVISPDHETWCRLLCLLSPPHVSLLKTIVLNKGLFDWWRAAIKNASEFKSFVDLAHIDAGESDIDVDRVSTLDSVGSALQGVIYTPWSELFVGRQVQPSVLFRCMAPAFGALQRDPKGFLAKIEDLARNQAWLRNVQASHGSVESSSVKQAADLVQRGVFVLGGGKELVAVVMPLREQDLSDMNHVVDEILSDFGKLDPDEFSLILVDSLSLLCICVLFVHFCLKIY